MSYLHQPQQPAPDTNMIVPPCPIDRLEAPFINNPYHTPPTHPAFQSIPPTYQRILPAIIGALISRTQNYARSNPARTAFFNLCFANNFNNQYFHDTVLTVLDLVMARSVDLGRDPTQLVEETMDAVMSPLIAKLIWQDYPGIQQYMDQQTLHASTGEYTKFTRERTNALDKAPQGRRMFEQMYGQPQAYQSPQPQQYAQQGYPQQTMGYQSQPMQGQQWYNNQPVPQGGPHINMPGPQTGGPFGMQQGGPVQGNFPNAPGNNAMAANSTQMQGFFNAPGQPAAPQYARDNSYQTQKAASKDYTTGQRDLYGAVKVVEAITPDGRYHDYRTDQQRQQDYQNRHHTHETLSAPYQPPVQASTPPTPPAPTPQPDTTPETITLDNGATYNVEKGVPISSDERPWDSWVAKKDGTTLIMVPEHLSLWTIDDPKWVANIAYDPRIQLRCHVKSLDDNIVRQAVIDYYEDGSMDYLRNEISPVYRVKGGPNRDSVRKEANWEQVQNIRPLPTGDDEETQKEVEDIKSFKTPFQVPKPLVGETLRDVEFKRDLFFLDHELDGDLHNKTHEFEYHQTVKFLDLKTDLADESLLSEMVAATAVGSDVTLPSYHHDFVGLKGVIDDRVWHFLNDESTVRVNDILANNMGKDLAEWSIDDFAEDFPSLRDALAEFYNDDEKGQEIFELFEKFAREKVILAGYRVVVGEELDTYMKEELGDLGTNYSMVRDRILVLRKINSVTQVDWETSDMPELFDGETSLLVIKAKRNKLYNSMADILARAKKRSSNKTQRHYIRTRDNVSLLVEVGAYSSEYLMLRMVNDQ